MIVAGFGWLALSLAAGAGHAQDTNTVGNPQLKDFQLPGTRTVPPSPAQEQPEPTTNTAAPPPAAQPPETASPPAQTPAAPPPSAAREPSVGEPAAPAPARPVRREAAPAEPPAVTAAPEVPAGVPAPAELEQAFPSPPAAAPPLATPPPAMSAEPERPWPWLAIGIGALLALLALLGLLAFKRSRAAPADNAQAEAAAAVEAQPDVLPAPDPLFAKRAPAPAAPAPAAPAPVPASTAPAPAPAAPAGGFVGVVMRPRLELEFRAQRAAATLTEAVVQYELVVRNVGNAAAGGVRLQAFMTNAGPEQDREIGDFYSQSSLKEEPVAIAALPPGNEALVKSSLTLPRDQLREITVQGRRLFIPIVAFNVYYEWGDGRSGQTSMSYVVGREAPTPQEKMGAFRLDLGPRLYRSVGQRQAKLAKVV
jgi:hypothetical protein